MFGLVTFVLIIHIGERGIIDGGFGTTGKYRVNLPGNLFL